MRLRKIKYYGCSLVIRFCKYDLSDLDIEEDDMIDLDTLKIIKKGKVKK